MVILFENKQFDDKKQALTEFAFCHYPLVISVDDTKYEFEDFSSLEAFFNALDQTP